MADSQKTKDLMVLLESHYDSQKFAFVPQVPNATGLNKSRTADALVMGLWPSIGLDLMGFEVKTSRADWKKEMSDFHKADAFSKYCDLWYLVTTEGVAHAEELPSGWGWLVSNGQKLKVARQASRNPNPHPIDRTLLAAMFRAINRVLPGKKELQEAERIGFRSGYDKGRESVEKLQKTVSPRDFQELKQKLSALTETVNQFEATTGVELSSVSERWGHARKVGKLVNYLSKHGGDQLLAAAMQLQTNLVRDAEKWTKIVDGMKQILTDSEGHDA